MDNELMLGIDFNRAKSNSHEIIFFSTQFLAFVYAVSARNNMQSKLKRNCTKWVVKFCKVHIVHSHPIIRLQLFPKIQTIVAIKFKVQLHNNFGEWLFNVFQSNWYVLMQSLINIQHDNYYLLMSDIFGWK